MTVVQRHSESSESYVARLSREFENKYKYKIAGEDDLLFSAVGRVIKDPDTFKMLKSRKLNELYAIKNIEATITDPDEQQLAIAKEKMAFQRMAARAIKEVEYDQSAINISSALSRLSSNLYDHITDYSDAKAALGGAVDPGEDATFFNSINYSDRKLDGIILTQKPRLISDGKFFNISMYLAENNMDDVQNAIDVFV